MPAMSKPLALIIGLRYIRSKRREGFVSFLALFSMIAMALGVAALIIVLSVMNGLGAEIRSRIVQVASHLTVESSQPLSQADYQHVRDTLVDDPDVVAVEPLVSSYAMLASTRNSAGAVMQGIDAVSSASGEKAAILRSGSWQRLADQRFGIVIGQQLSRQLGVFEGDLVQLTVPRVAVTPAGLFPRTKRFTVVGIYESGAQIDAMMVYLNRSDAQTLLQLGNNYSGAEIVLHDPYTASAVAERWRQQFAADWRWQSWLEQMASLLQAMKMEKIVVGLLLSIIIAVAAFNIIASLVLMVAEKRSDIAVLRTLGMTSGQISAVFRVTGLAVATIGILLGTVVGGVIAFFVGDIVAWVEQLFSVYLFDPDLYYVTRLPSEVLALDVAMVVTAAALLALMATLYPAYRAGLIHPAEALRYDR